MTVYGFIARLLRAFGRRKQAAGPVAGAPPAVPASAAHEAAPWPFTPQGLLSGNAQPLEAGAAFSPLNSPQPGSAAPLPSALDAEAVSAVLAVQCRRYANDVAAQEVL